MTEIHIRKCFCVFFLSRKVHGNEMWDEMCLRAAVVKSKTKIDCLLANWNGKIQSLFSSQDWHWLLFYALLSAFIVKQRIHIKCCYRSGFIFMLLCGWTEALIGTYTYLENGSKFLWRQMIPGKVSYTFRSMFCIHSLLFWWRSID